MSNPRKDPHALVAVARITRPYGLKGEVKVIALTETGEELYRFSRFILVRGGERQILEVESLRPGGGHHLILKPASVHSRDEAELLRGKILFVERRELAPIEEADTYYFHDLVGLEVLDTEGIRIGTVHDVHRFGIGETLEIRTPEGAFVLVPFAREYVVEVNLEEGWLRIRRKEGLV